MNNDNSEQGAKAVTTKTDPGNFFEDFKLGQRLVHATPRTVTAGDVALYTALYGPRFSLFSSEEFAKACGLMSAPVDPLIAFHVVFGKTVPDMLKSDLAVEYKVDGELKKAIAACEKAQDYVTREMLVVQLDDTEMDHAYFLEKQLKLIEMVGLENYQQSQMGSTPV
ncbi:ferritin-like domain-containing protein [uncultured Caulobacter sp.]|uniref:ferritin-like domain-containing protein n=1 Tax=uncultured Caulobacter sp. TaxID=158749 RepID=UPI00262C185E|nr:ferritin-like domain-containing protein [uncultured Caulobacter sp.]